MNTNGHEWIKRSFIRYSSVSPVYFNYILQGPKGSVLPLNPNIKELGLNFYFAYHVIHTIVIHTSVNRIRRPSSVRPSTISNNFFSETAWPIKAKFYVEPPWVGGTKVCSQYLGHIIKMAAMPIYGKNP